MTSRRESKVPLYGALMMLCQLPRVELIYICSSWRISAQAYTLPTASCVFSGHRLHVSTIMTGVPPTSCTHTAVMSSNHISGPPVELSVWVGLPPLPHSDCCPPSVSFTARLMRSRRPTYQRRSDACLKGLIKHIPHLQPASRSTWAFPSLPHVHHSPCSLSCVAFF